jgi:hypothetical protein
MIRVPVFLRLFRAQATFGQGTPNCAFLSIKYPVFVDPYSESSQGDDVHQGLVATATVLLPRVKAKLYVSFILDTDTFWGWPAAIGNVDCTIKKAYGPEIEFFPFVILWHWLSEWMRLVFRRSVQLSYSACQRQCPTTIMLASWMPASKPPWIIRPSNDNLCLFLYDLVINNWWISLYLYRDRFIHTYSIYYNVESKEQA